MHAHLLLAAMMAGVAPSIVESRRLSTWSILYHGDKIGRRVAIDNFYRRGGSDDADGGNLSTYSDEEAASNATATSALSSLTGKPLLHSASSVQGERLYMEDEYLVEQGRFAAVFDGHGGAAVSRYLRQNLYANFQAALPTSAALAIDASIYQHHSQSSIVASALEAALDKVGDEVGSISHWSFQGSTALAAVIHENIEDGSRSIVTANVGDSRAILSRGRKAIDLTKDHKPNDITERERIVALGGRVDWCGQVDNQGNPIEHTGVYRINGNLALSRSIGDRSERPWVTNKADLAHTLIDEEQDAFVLLATDGLFDVMTSQDVVSFVHEVLDGSQPTQRREIQRVMSRYLAEEALRRGSLDNITVLVLWLNEADE